MMQDPRYVPPASPLADPSPVRPLAARPVQVEWAMNLLWLSLILSIPETMLGIWHAEGDGFVAIVGVAMALFALAAWLNFKIYEGRNWARFVLLMLTAIAIDLVLFSPEPAPSEDLFLQSLSVLSVLADVVAAGLVFTKPGSLWFVRSQ